MHYHLDLIGGLAGDMFLAAAIDANIVEIDALTAGLRTLGLGTNLSIEVTRERRGALAGTHVTFKDWDPDADADYRYLSDILKMIDESGLPDAVKGRASSLFFTLGKSEARVHGMSLEDVHFHEVGAVDSILDFVSAAWIIEYGENSSNTWSVGAIPTGQGTIVTAHGEIPVPVPATLNLLVGLRLKRTDITSELVTPTGAAIIADLVNDGRLVQLSETTHAPTDLPLTSIGYGLGTKDFGHHANAVRLSCFGAASSVSNANHEIHTPKESLSDDSTYETVVKLTCEVDDMQPEILAHVCEKTLPTCGAIDVVRIPVIMKCGRAAVQLQVLCYPHERQHLIDVILAETTSLGVRVEYIERAILSRRIETRETPWGTVQVKVATIHGAAKLSLEYRSVAELAKKHDVSLLQMWHQILHTLND